MGGTPGPAPRSMQLSHPSLLSYLQRFNKKRRIHYKIHLQPTLHLETPAPRIKAMKVQRLPRPSLRDAGARPGPADKASPDVA